MTSPAISDSSPTRSAAMRSEEHTSELQSPCNLVCRLLLEKKHNDTEIVRLISRQVEAIQIDRSRYLASFASILTLAAVSVIDFSMVTSAAIEAVVAADHAP